MENCPMVSIVMATYNRSYSLTNSIDAILNQTFNDFELLIVSDGSTDDTLEVLEAYKDSRLKVYDLKVNCGLPGKVRNIGMKHALGKYIAFCDDDDIWLPDKLKIQIDYLEENPGTIILASNALFFPGYEVPALFLFKDKRIYLKEILKGNVVMTPSVVLRSSVLSVIGFFDEHPTLRFGEDLEYWLRVLKYRDGSIVVLRDFLFKCRLGNNKITQEEDIVKKMLRSFNYISAKHEVDAFRIQFSKINYNSLRKVQMSIEMFRLLALGRGSFCTFMEDPKTYSVTMMKIGLKLFYKFVIRGFKLG